MKDEATAYLTVLYQNTGLKTFTSTESDTKCCRRGLETTKEDENIMVSKDPN
jgi:hypothetical protein